MGKNASKPKRPAFVIQKDIKSALKKVRAISGEKEVYLVGGFIRDLLCGRSSTDCDFCVKQYPERLSREVSRSLSGNWFVLDREFQSYRVLIRSGKITFNLDFSRMNGASINEDLSCRDFTVNAMAVHVKHIDDIKGNILDNHGGIKDIMSRKISSISDENLKNDPLRLLRAYRIASETGFTVDKKTLKSIRSFSELILKSAPERIKEELYKILRSDDSCGIFKQLDRAGLLEKLFPEVTACRNLAKVYYKKEGVLTHLYQSLEKMDFITLNTGELFGRMSVKIRAYLDEIIPGGYPRWVTLKLASLLHDVGKAPTAKMRSGRLRFFYHEDEGEKMVKQISERFRLSSREREIVALMALGHMRPGNLAYQSTITDRAKYRFFRDYGDNAVSLLLISLADRFTYLSPRQIKARKDRHHTAIISLLRHFYTQKEKISPKKIIDGNRLMSEFNLKPGPLIGGILESLQEAQAMGKVRNYKDAISYAQKIVDKSSKI